MKLPRTSYNDNNNTNLYYYSIVVNYLYIHLFNAVEIKGERAQIKCKVLQGVQIANEWRTAVSQSCDYSKVESEFCSLYDLTENEKLSEVLRSFPEDVVEKKLVGIILNNYEDNLTLAEDFLGEENVQDIFVCVVSRSHHYRLKSLMEGATSETKVRVIHSSSVDSQELAHTTGKFYVATVAIGELLSMKQFEITLLVHNINTIDNFI